MNMSAELGESGSADETRFKHLNSTGFKWFWYQFKKIYFKFNPILQNWLIEKGYCVYVL